MAKDKKSNVSSPSRSTPKVSAPSPTSIPSKESVSPEKQPPSNKSEPLPSPSQPPPSPPPPRSSPPSPSPSSPPSPTPTPPPPSKLRAPPPRSSPPPSKHSPPSPPPSPSPPPPTTTLPPSPPSPSSSSPPPPPTSSSQSPNTGSPPPSVSPPPPQDSTPPSPGSYASPPSPAQTRPPPLQSPPPVSPGSQAKPSAPSSKTPGPSTSPPSKHHETVQYIGFGFAAVFLVAFMVVILFMVLKRKDKRGNVYGLMPPPKKSQMKGGDVHYYIEETGLGNGTPDMYYSTGNHVGSVQHLGTPPDAAAAQQPVSAGQIVFSYDKIVEITDGFSEENVIGEGGFGRVYKASMPDGRVGAVKLLKAGSGQGEREFKAEVEIISRIHHRHLVSLIGYCIAEQQRVLIYEFVPNGNLDQHLHESERMVLDWPKRMKIAIGAARGLAYLHEGCNPKIIHRDIKSANILLDDAYEAQVADFGLARLTNDANTHVSTRVMGTFGYMAPEYATSGKLTDRSDVFSFGVVLLELVTGRKPVDPDQPVGDESLVEWARPHLIRAIGTGDFSKLVDPRLEQYVDTEMFRMIEAAAACVRHSTPKRPSMVQIARALDSGDQLYDLSNGVKYGQSTVYDSGQYNEEIRRFNGRDNSSSFGDSEFDLYSREYNSRDMSGPSRIPIQSSSGDLEIRTFQGQISSADNRS